VDRGFHDGAGQHANCATQQRFTRLGVRQAVPVQRTHERGLVGGGAGGIGRHQLRRQCNDRAGQSLLPAFATPVGRPGLAQTGTGPSEAARERGFYKAETYTTTTSGARYIATMAQRGDPGYKATAVLLGESGLSLALDRDALSELRGVLTPAAAMGDALLARFPAAEVSLETARLMHR
jgi:hypothetical protein